MASTTLTSESLSQPSQWTTALGRWLPPSLGVASLILYVIVGLAGIRLLGQPFIGATLTPTMVVNAGVPSGSTTWNGLAAGLRRQDFVIAVNGQPLAADLSDFAAMRATYASLAQTWRPGDMVTFEVIRKAIYAPIDIPECQAISASRARCSFTFAIQTLPSEDFVSFFGVAYVAGLLVMAMGWAVWHLRRQHSDGQLASSSMFLSAVFIGGLFDVGTTQVITPFWLVWAAFAGATLATFSLIFPSRLPIVRKNPPLLLVPFIISGVVSAYAVYKQFNPLDPYDYGASQLSAFVSVGAVIFLTLVMAFVQRPRALTEDARDQVNAILIGASMLLIPAVIWLINRALMASLRISLPVAFEALMPLSIFTNAAIAYAVLQFRVLNTDRVISQSITYSIMLGTLVISIFLIALGGTLIAVDLFNANSVLTISIILFVMVMGFSPLRNRIQEQIDRVYFRARRNYQQQVEEFGRDVARSLPFEDLTLKFRQVLQENASRIFIFLIDRDAQAYVDYAPQGRQTDISLPLDGPIIKMMSGADQPIVLERGEPLPPELWTDRARLQLLRAHLLVPMRGADRLNGVVILGGPLSGRSFYNFEETRFIVNLTNQYAVATERAQVIASLERRVRELDVLSQVGQAVNFTTEFDDLLELISAQTARLISAPCFYIALYDEEAKQLYFAFFSEDDDRHSDKENVRWSLDDGLFSDVVREGRALRVTDYAREMARRDVAIKLEARDMRAWMGMPLSAGRRILGVIALGKRKTSEPFSDEQFKIFSDISALAATSIDKARLFTETKIRERQLTVLNDISRKLVATESDVEKLLEIIMSSAVDILNAEAGSLLLNTEDSSQDLEFRVVIGGSGANLIGQRISSGTGIAGQVVKTGRALIVNDTASNPDHRGDLQSDFKASSLLAVPLIAKETVIGVLEVLNKRDGTSFTQADSDLLTTFAGQAAVAIENARLFRMTDIQLSQRVRELEALERIDSELNRTLDVAQVASITVRSAMRILGAQGGLLGILNEAATQLEIVTIEGYDPDDYPDTAEGLIWPLDRGIIRRVVRLRQPDIAVDVSIDPDFERGIKGCLSQITIPMFSGDDLNAILILERNQLPRFSLTDWSFAQRIAEHASIAIANAQLYAALMRANKSKSDFMGFAAHELKNPLASVKGYADVLLTGMTGALSEQQKSFVSIIHSNANRMQTIIDDLRASAQLDADEFRVDLEPMNIWNAVLETLRPFVHFLRDKNQELINEVPEDLPLIMGDSTRLIQVLTNLVSNAHKYSPPDTTIRITARVEQNFIDQKGKRRGPMVVVSVIDQGIGMSEDDQKRLFREKYFRSTNKAAQEQPGTGLGMMLTQGIIHKHNGEIWIESELGKGSVFSIALPLAPQEFQTRIGELSGN